MTPRRARAHLTMYKALLFLYPPSFRREFGGPMVQLFAARLNDRGPTRTWLLIAGDLAASVPQQLMEASAMNEKLLAGVAVLAATIVAVAAGIGLAPPAPLLTAGALCVLLLIAAFVPRRNDRPAEYVYRAPAPKIWTWWAGLAAVLGVAYVLAAAGQLIGEPKATNLGAMGIAFGFAVLIGSGLFLRARSRVVGNWMIVFGTVPALMFFWMVVPALVGVAIIVGAVAEAARTTPRFPQEA